MDADSERRRRLQTRSAPIGILAAIAFLGGVLVGASGGGSEAAARFADAWERQDFAAMHAELSTDAQEQYPVEDFTARYVDAQATATAVRVVTGETEEGEVEGADAAVFDTTVDTRAFGQVAGRVEVPLDDDGLVAWEPHLTFPGLTAGEELDRVTRAGERAPLLARDGEPPGGRPGDGSQLAAGGVGARHRRLGRLPLAQAGTRAVRAGLPGGGPGRHRAASSWPSTPS